MAIPQSVIEKGKRADEIIKQLSQGPAQEPAPQAPAGFEQVMDHQVQPQDPAAGTEVQPDSTGVNHNWKDRFAGLQNAHSATLSELKQARAQSTAREAELMKRMADMEAKLNEQTLNKPIDRSYLSEEDLTLFGEDNLQIVEKVVRKVVGEALAVERQQRQTERERDMVATNARTAAAEKKTEFLKRLRGLVENFDAIDNDPKFDAWCKEVDPVTGFTRSELISRAYSVNDVGRAASFYGEFVDQTRSPDPRENFIQPKPSGQPPTPPPQGQKNIWTKAGIKRFYEVKADMEKRDPARAAALEADLFAAQREGRVRG